MDRLTKRQREVLYYLKKFVSKNKYSPSRQEISDHFKFKSANAAQDYLVALKKKGFIKFDYNIPRSIKILDDKCEWVLKKRLYMTECGAVFDKFDFNLYKENFLYCHNCGRLIKMKDDNNG